MIYRERLQGSYHTFTPKPTFQPAAANFVAPNRSINISNYRKNTVNTMLLDTRRYQYKFVMIVADMDQYDFVYLDLDRGSVA